MSKLLKSDEVADILGISEWTVREWFKNGTLKGAKHGRQWRMTEEDLNTYLKEKHG